MNGCNSCVPRKGAVWDWQDGTERRDKDSAAQGSVARPQCCEITRTMIVDSKAHLDALDAC